MPNQIDSSGIQVKTYSEIVDYLTAQFTAVYGSDVNFDQNSPDGQIINIIALIVMDQGDLAVQIYNALDPDTAVGIALDALAQFCGMTRKGGTYTKVVVDVTTDRAVNLDGLDTSTTPYTVQDSNGVQFQLIASASLTTGVNSLNFQAADIGAVQISANTLTTPSTTVLGVLSVNNPAVPYEDGEDQENDALFRVRRQQSIATPAQGLLEGLIGGLLELDGVSEAFVYENTDASADGDGIPGHGIWVIVDGGTDADVADMINKYRPMGVPMAGGEIVTVDLADGSTIDIQFDRAVDEDLYIDMDVSSLSGGAVETASLKTALVAAWTFGVYETADITKLNSLVREINPDLVINSAGLAKMVGPYLSSYDPTCTPTSKQNKFVLETAHITVTT